MRAKTITFTMTAADPNGVLEAYSPSGAETLTLDGALTTGGVATMDVARHIVVDSSSAGDTTQTVTLTGTNRSGKAISETIALNGTTAVAGTENFKTITAATVSASMAGNLTIGTTNTADTAWVPWDWRVDECQISVFFDGSFEMTYSAQHTMDRLMAAGATENGMTTLVGDSAMSAETTAAEMRREGTTMGSRIQIESFSSGTMVAVFTQPQR